MDNLRNIKAVIFDLDGTIGNTLPLCVAAFREAIEPLSGKTLSDREIFATFGPSEEGTIRQLIPEHYDRGVEDYLSNYERLHDMCPEPFEGMREIIGGLKARNVIVALVTGKGARSCEITMRRYGMEGVFDMIECGSPLGERKKKCITAVVERFGLDPEEAVYVGDSPLDITASRNAGVGIIAAGWAPTAEPGTLRNMGPDYIMESIPEFGRLMEDINGDPE